MLMKSHVDKNVVTQASDLVRDEFRKLTITWGRKNHYLGSQIDCTNTKQVQITLYDYKHNMLNELPQNMYGGANTPTANHFVLSKLGSSKLNEKNHN